MPTPMTTRSCQVQAHVGGFHIAVRARCRRSRVGGRGQWTSVDTSKAVPRWVIPRRRWVRTVDSSMPSSSPVSHAGPPERHDEQHTDALRLAEIGQRRDDGRLDVGDRRVLDRVGDRRRPPRLALSCLSGPVQISGRIGHLADSIPVLPAGGQRLGSSGERFEAHDQREPRQTKNRDSRTQILPKASLGRSMQLSRELLRWRSAR